jgi:integrase
MARRTQVKKQRRRGAGEGSVYFESATGRWRAAVHLPNGKVKRLSASTQREAAAKLRAFQPSTVTGSVTLAEFVELWLDGLRASVESGDLVESSLENKRYAVQPVVDALGSRQLSAITTGDVQWALRDMADRGRARNTIKLTRGQLCLCLDRALAAGLVDRNVARLALMPNGISPSKQKRESMTVDQARALLKAAKGERLEALFVTALLLGLRPGELLGLRWSDVDFDRAKLRISSALHRDGTFGPPKTPESVATLDMPVPVADALRAHRVRQSAEQLKAHRWTDTDAVFATRVGTPTDDSNLRRVNARLCEKAGLGKWTPHEYRHTAGSLLLDAGVPREDVRRVLRHKNLRMLDEVYGHEVRPSVDAAVAPMERLFGGTL